MSEDIVSPEAFILRFSDFVNLLKPEHLPGIKADAVRLFLKRTADKNDAGVRNRVSQYTTAIKSAQTIGDVADFLISLVKDGIRRKIKRFSEEVYKDVFANENQESEDITEISLIRCISRIVLPLEPESVVLFWGYRDYQWDGPFKEPLLQFGADECFERRMTDAGEAMARSLGKPSIGLSGWVERN